MNKRQQKREQARRAVFVGCQFCGATDRTLRNYGSGKICPACMVLKQWDVPNSGTGEERK